MDIITLDTTNFTGLTSRYVNDNKLRFNEHVLFSEQGINVPLNDALKGVNDSTVNNFSNLLLSRKALLTSAVYIDDLDKLDDEGFSTYFATNAAGALTPSTRFWVVAEPAVSVNIANISLSGSLGNVNNRYFFDVELITEKLCKISHENDNVIRYLTVDYTGNLSFAKDAGLDPIGALSPQIFYYVYDRSYNYIVLIKNINDIPKFVTFSPFIQGLTLVSPITGTSVPYSVSSVFRIRPRNPIPNNTLLYDPWVSYKKDFKTNSQDINIDRSYNNIESNLLLHNEYYNISGNSIDLNIVSLKNTNTSEDLQSRGNPFFNENNVEFRDYLSLYSGSNQAYGNDNISLNYETYSTSILLKKDKVTYFHIPQDFYPFIRLNINDSGLVNSGAIAGDHPLKSDKIFKKKGDYKNTSNFGDTIEEQSGEFLCAWLSGSPDVEVAPVWVDRYYNPKSTSFIKALTALDLKAIRYISIFDCLQAKAEELLGDVDVFDKPSDLVFEKGTYYAYHHYGPKDVDNFINSISENLVSKNFTLYKYYDNSNVFKSPLDTDEFVFNGVEYAQTSSLSSIQESNQFTVVFDGYSTDWNKSLGYQLVGNYDRDGFGIFNENIVTPTLFVNTPSAIHVTNLNSKQLNTLVFNAEVKGIIRPQGLNDFYLIMSDHTFRRFNLSYAETRNSKHVSNQLIGNLKGLDYTEDFAFEVFNNGGSSNNRICLLNLKSNEVTDITSSTKYTRRFACGSALNPSPGIAAVNTINYYKTDSDEYICMTPGTKAERVNDSIYYLKDNKIFRWNNIDLVNSCVYTTTAFYSDNSIEDFSLDFNNNLWVLYKGNYFAKYTQNREFILSGYIADSDYSNFKIEFGADFDNGIYNRYAFIIKKSTTYPNKLKFEKLTLSGDKIDTNIFDNKSEIFKAGVTPCLNVSNSNFLRSFVMGKYPDSNLNVKAKLVNVFNSNDTAESEIVFSLSALDPGYHNFGVRFDADGGYMYLFIDGQQKGVSEFLPRKYKFSNIIYRPFLVGSSNYAHSIPLFKYLKNKSFLVSDFKVKNFFIYDKPLYDCDIMMHAKKNMDIKDIHFDVACGRRNYQEEIERYFKLDTPGSKSTLFNLVIRNSTITDPELKNQLEKRIISLLQNSAPAYAKLNNIKWRG